MSSLTSNDYSKVLSEDLIPFIRAFGGIVGDKERKKDNLLQKAVTLQVPRDAAEAFFAERARLRVANGGRRRKKNPKPWENNDDEEVGDDSEEEDEDGEDDRGRYAMDGSMAPSSFPPLAPAPWTPIAPAPGHFDQAPPATQGPIPPLPAFRPPPPRLRPLPNDLKVELKKADRAWREANKTGLASLADPAEAELAALQKQAMEINRQEFSEWVRGPHGYGEW
tara:strand:- start:13194 stop:13862 length:669 start_codon:yes stop_codon:yes gene_type:complete